MINLIFVCSNPFVHFSVCCTALKRTKLLCTPTLFITSGWHLYWFQMSTFWFIWSKYHFKNLLNLPELSRYYHINPILPAWCFISVGLQPWFFCRLHLLKIHNGFATEESLAGNVFVYNNKPEFTVISHTRVLMQSINIKKVTAQEHEQQLFRR